MSLEHPVLRQRAFVIQSPPLKRFEEAFFQLLARGELALCGYGVPRVGKTTAGQYLRYRLGSEKIAAYRIASLEQQQGPRVDRAEFWRRFMADSLTAFSVKWTTPASARNALISALMVDAEALDTKKIVLAVDEAQYLTAQHLSMLKLLIEDLINLGMSPFLLTLAQPEILERPAQLIKHNYHDLVDRFFIHWHRFKGLAPAEFALLLEAYDNLKWAPEEGAPASTFTQFFSPELAARGGLKQLAPYFEEYFKQANLELGSRKVEEFETKFLVTAVRIFFLAIRETPRLLDQKKLGDSIRAAVMGSGIYENRRIVGDATVLTTPGKP